MSENLNHLSPAARLFVDALKPHTPFAEAIVRRQCERAGVSFTELTDDQIDKVLPLVVAAASAFVDPSVISHLRWLCASRRK